MALFFFLCFVCVVCVFFMWVSLPGTVSLGCVHGFPLVAALRHGALVRSLGPLPGTTVFFGVGNRFFFGVGRCQNLFFGVPSHAKKNGYTPKKVSKHFSARDQLSEPATPAVVSPEGKGRETREKVILLNGLEKINAHADKLAVSSIIHQKKQNCVEITEKSFILTSPNNDGYTVRWYQKRNTSIRTTSQAALFQSQTRKVRQ